MVASLTWTIRNCPAGVLDVRLVCHRASSLNANKVQLGVPPQLERQSDITARAVEAFEKAAGRDALSRPSQARLSQRAEQSRTNAGRRHKLGRRPGTTISQCPNSEMDNTSTQSVPSQRTYSIQSRQVHVQRGLCPLHCTSQRAAVSVRMTGSGPVPGC